MVRDLFQLNTLCKRFFIGSIALFVILAATYGFFLKQTVATVVERRSIEADRSELAARVSMLEADYIRAADAVTLARARELGFATISPTRFVSRASNTFSFDYPSHESR